VSVDDTVPSRQRGPTLLGEAPTPLVMGLPVYNGSRFLAEAVDSLLDQTYGDFILILADNASTDDTEEICRTFAARDPRIRYVRRPRNIGAVANYNGTFDLAQSYNPSFFKWCAHDDVCASTLLDHCIHDLRATPNAVLSYPRTVLIDEDGHQLTGLVEDPPRATNDDPIERFRDILFHEVWCFPIFGVMRTRVLAEAGPFLPFSSSDKVLLSKLALLGRFSQTSEVLFLRRVHDSQLTVMAPADKARWAGRGHARVPEPVFALEGYLRALREVPLTCRQRRDGYLALTRFLGRRDKWKKTLLPGPYNYLGWRGRKPNEPYAHLQLERVREDVVPSPSEEAGTETSA